ncbi:MAG: Fur family transcriptional regulator [Solirubrobacteraceae bacterium]
MAVASRLQWTEHALRVLGAEGHRRARAREALIDLLGSERCALSAFEVEERLRADGRPVARASVYRILELLVELRLVGRLELGDGIVRYERIDPAGEHHHHLVCDVCGQLVPFDDRGLERSIDRLSERLGFRADAHEVVLHGACGTCRD